MDLFDAHQVILWQSPYKLHSKNNIFPNKWRTMKENNDNYLLRWLFVLDKETISGWLCFSLFVIDYATAIIVNIVGCVVYIVYIRSIGAFDTCPGVLIIIINYITPTGWYRRILHKI